MRILAVIVLLAAVVIWAAKGANCGWTINNLEHHPLDPVTGLTGSTWEKVFIPGFDFLVYAAAGAGVLVGASFLFRKKRAGT